MAQIVPDPNEALIVVDVQRDFLPGGALAVAHGGPWPPHCVAGTPGAEFAAELKLPRPAIVVSKAESPDADSYSAFGGTDLAQQLERRGVQRVYVGGLATDYCVLNTVLDARAAGLEVVVLRDAVRAVEVAPGDGERAMAKMEQAGARLLPA